MDFTDTLWGRPNTIKTQKSLYNNWIDFYTPWLQTEEGLLSVIKEWQKKELAPRTIKSLISLTSRYIKWEHNLDIDTRKYVSIVMRAQQQSKIKALTRIEGNSLIKVFNRKRNKMYVPVAIGYYAGLRKGEVFGLEWDDINFLQKTIEVNRSYDGPTKNGRSRRLPMSDDLHDILLGEYKPSKSKGRIIPLVFDPNPLLKAACRCAKIPIITFHGLRHTFATLALEERQYSPKAVQMILGHSNLSTTLDIYWSVTSELNFR